MKNEYELMLVLSPKATESDEKKMIELVKAQLSNGGKVVSETQEGKKQLAYPIRREKEGIFWLLTLSDGAGDIKNLTNKLQQEQLVLRFLLVLRNEGLVKNDVSGRDKAARTNPK